MLTFFVFLFGSTVIYAFFAIFVLVTFDVLCLKSVRLKHIDCFSYFLESNYRGLNLKLAQLLIYGDIESNLGSRQNDCKSPRGCPKKIKVFKETPKSLILVRTVMLLLLVIQKCKMFFSMQYNLSA